jgi:hypothetical protein
LKAKGQKGKEIVKIFLWMAEAVSRKTLTGKIVKIIRRSEESGLYERTSEFFDNVMG